MKTAIVLLVATLLACVVVSADSGGGTGEILQPTMTPIGPIPLPHEPCNWTRPATLFREARNFTGVWGRLSNGSITCFTPNRIHHTKKVGKKPVVIPPVEITPSPGVPEFSPITMGITIIISGLGLAMLRKK